MNSLLRAFNVIEHLNIVSGALLNSLLLYLIHRFSRKDIGEYRMLLSAFSSFDIVLCFMHWLIAPKALCFGTTFSAVAHSYWESRYITIMYASIYTIPFGIMNLNFLYRYWSIKNPQRLAIFSNKYIKPALFLSAFSGFSIWYFLTWWGSSGEVNEIGTVIARGIYLEKYNRTIVDGWLLMDHWRNGKFNVRAGILLLAIDSIMITSFTAASVIGILTYRNILRAHLLSTRARIFHRKLLIALCAQTFVPLVFVYVPYFCIGTFPFLGWPDYHISDASGVLTSSFPVWDAAVIIYLMKDYREGLWRLVLCGKKKTVAATGWKSISRQIVAVSTLTHQ